MTWFVVLATLAATVFSSAPAYADGRPYVGTSSADMFWCTSTQSLCANTSITHVPGGTPVTMVCWRDDRQPFPGSSPRWFYVFLDNGQEGFMWAPQISNQTPSVPNCSTANWINVSDWAIGRIGLTQWRSASQDGPYPGMPYRTDVSPPGYYWAGWCLGFAANAWSVAGGGGLLGGSTAIDAWNRYVSQGRADSNPAHRPPRGAMVFWNDSHNGHVAISLGNWQAVGTWLSGNATDPIQTYGVLNSPAGAYLGWVMPTTSMPYNTYGW